MIIMMRQKYGCCRQQLRHNGYLVYLLVRISWTKTPMTEMPRTFVIWGLGFWGWGGHLLYWLRKINSFWAIISTNQDCFLSLIHVTDVGPRCIFTPLVHLMQLPQMHMASNASARLGQTNRDDPRLDSHILFSNFVWREYKWGYSMENSERWIVLCE